MRREKRVHKKEGERNEKGWNEKEWRKGYITRKEGRNDKERRDK
jgi:hypothetical protein